MAVPPHLRRAVTAATACVVVTAVVAHVLVERWAETALLVLLVAGFAISDVAREYAMRRIDHRVRPNNGYRDVGGQPGSG